MSLESNTPSPEREVLAGTKKVFLESAVDRLPDAYRSVFMLREVEGLGAAETAECLDLVEETVKVRLQRARHLIHGNIYAETGAAMSKAFQFLGARCDRMVSAVLERIEALKGSARNHAEFDHIYPDDPALNRGLNGSSPGKITQS